MLRAWLIGARARELQNDSADVLIHLSSTVTQAQHRVLRWPARTTKTAQKMVLKLCPIFQAIMSAEGDEEGARDPFTAIREGRKMTQKLERRQTRMRR